MPGLCRTLAGLMMPDRKSSPSALAILLILSSAAPAQEADSPRAVLPDPLAAGWKGAPVCEVLHEDLDQRVLRCAFPPGVGHERHYHRPHFGYVIAGGLMRIEDEGGTREVATEAGSHWASDGVGWHEVLNVGATTSVYLIVEPTDSG